MSTTKLKATHTATPWATGENGDGCAKGHAIVADGMVIGKVYGRGYPTGAGYHPQSAADAEFIVRAVNSHADMLEALEEAAKLMPLGTAMRAEWLTRTSAILAKARGIA